MSHNFNSFPLAYQYAFILQAHEIAKLTECEVYIEISRKSKTYVYGTKNKLKEHQGLLSDETTEVTQLDQSTQNADTQALNDIQMEIEVITSEHDPPEDLPMSAEPAMNVLQDWQFLQADEVIETLDSIDNENKSSQENIFDHSYTVTKPTTAPAQVPAPAPAPKKAKRSTRKRLI